MADAPPQKPARPPKPSQLVHASNLGPTATSADSTAASDSTHAKDTIHAGSTPLDDKGKHNGNLTAGKPQKPPRGPHSHSSPESSERSHLQQTESSETGQSHTNEPSHDRKAVETLHSMHTPSRSSVSSSLITLPGTPDQDGNEESGFTSPGRAETLESTPAPSLDSTATQASDGSKSSVDDESSTTKRRPTMVQNKDGRILPARPNTLRKKASLATLISVSSQADDSLLIAPESASTDQLSAISEDKKTEDGVLVEEKHPTSATEHTNVASSVSASSTAIGSQALEHDQTAVQTSSQEQKSSALHTTTETTHISLSAEETDQHTEQEEHEPVVTRERSHTFDPELGFDAASPFDIEALSEREAPKVKVRSRVPLPPSVKAPVAPNTVRNRSYTTGDGSSKRAIPTPPTTTPARVAPVVVPFIPVSVDIDADREEREIEKRLKKERKEQEKRGKLAAAAAAAAATATTASPAAGPAASTPSVSTASAPAPPTSIHLPTSDEKEDFSPSNPVSSPRSVSAGRLPPAGRDSSAGEINPSPNADADAGVSNSTPSDSSHSDSSSGGHRRTKSASEKPPKTPTSEASTNPQDHAVNTTASPHAEHTSEKAKDKSKDKESKGFFSKFTDRLKGKKHSNKAETDDKTAHGEHSADSESDSDVAPDPLLVDAALTPSVTPREGSIQGGDGAAQSTDSTTPEIPFPPAIEDAELAELETHRRTLISQIKNMEELHARLKATIAEEQQKLTETKTGRNRSKSTGNPPAANIVSSSKKKGSKEGTVTSPSTSPPTAPKHGNPPTSATNTKSPNPFQQFASVAGFSLSDGREGVAAGFGFKQKLGQSAFGSVYVCRQLKSGLMVCIRIVPFASSKEAKQHAAQFKTLVKMDCKMLASILAVAVSENELWLISEYCPIGSLRTLLETGALELEEDQIRIIARSCAKALDFLHRNQVTHGSVELANLLVDIVGDIKLCDYSLKELLISKRHSQTADTSVEPSFAEKVLKDIHGLGVALLRLAEWGEHENGQEPSGFRDPSRFSDSFESFVSSCLTTTAPLSELLEHPFLNAGSTSSQPLVDAIANTLSSLSSRNPSPSQTPTRTRQELDEQFKNNPDRVPLSRIQLHSRISSDGESSSSSPSQSASSDLTQISGSKSTSIQLGDAIETEEKSRQDVLTKSGESLEPASPSLKREMLHKQIEEATQKVLLEGHSDQKSALESLSAAFFKLVSEAISD